MSAEVSLMLSGEEDRREVSRIQVVEQSQLQAFALLFPAF